MSNKGGKSGRPSPTTPEGMSPYRERAIGIYERRLRGQTWKEITLIFGITVERAQQIVREHEEWLVGHSRAGKESEQLLEPIADEVTVDLPPTRLVGQSTDLSDAERRRRMRRWWLERYSREELLELAMMIWPTG
jgi:hypothetical protein